MWRAGSRIERESLPSREPALEAGEGGVWIIIEITPCCALLGKPTVESRFYHSGGGDLLSRSPHGQVIGILVLGVASMAPDPGQLDFVLGGGRHQGLPQLQVLDRPFLPFPPSCDPTRYPLAHSTHPILR